MADVLIRTDQPRSHTEQAYLYSRLRADSHRHIAHWRGAKGGLRVLSEPSVTAWLQRQANDASYDFWRDLSIGNLAIGDAEPDTAQATFIMQKESDGSWLIAPRADDTPVQLRPAAANAGGERFIIEMAGLSRG